MKWRNRRVSQNVEDQRGLGGRKSRKASGLTLVLVTLAAMYFGVDPKIVLSLLDNSAALNSSSQQPAYRPSAEQQQQYQEPKLVLFRNLKQINLP